MGETGVVRFQGTLNPRAQEFRPRNHVNLTQSAAAVFSLPVRHVYYPFVSPYLPPANGVQDEPFGNGGLVYPQFPVSPTYFDPSESMVLPQVPPTTSCPTRSLLLSSVPIDVSESVVRRDLEAFGDVRGVQMERIRDGIVTVHFYDLRHAEEAYREMRNRHSQRQRQLRSHCNAFSSHYSWVPRDNFEPSPRTARGLIGGSAVWAEFVVPVSNAIPDGSNQGTVIVFDLDPDVSTSTLKEIFERFGSVKELRETPLKKHRRFVEFFDVRDAANAREEINGKEIHGKPVVVEFSRPGGHGGKYFKPYFTSETSRASISPRHQQPPPPRPLKFFDGMTSSSSDPHRPLYSQAQYTPKKVNYMRGRSLNYADKLVEELQTLNCGGSAGNRIERRDFVGCSRRINARKIFNKQSPPASKQLVALPRVGVRSRKHNFLKNCDPCFLISENAEDDESHCRDSRTTVMIKNIPNKYSLQLLMNMLDNHCIHCNEQIAVTDGKDLPLSSYDFVYLPIDFNTKCNVGYGFVNMTSPEGAWRLYKAFHLQHWEVFNSRKICQVTYARVQGLEALKEHFSKSKFPSEMEQHELPVVFWPPREGVQLTEPLAVVGTMHVRREAAQHEDEGGEKLHGADESEAVVGCGGDSRSDEER